MIENFLEQAMIGISLLFLLMYTLCFLFLLCIFKIIIPLKKIKENHVEKHTYYRDKIDQYSPLMNAKLLGKDIFSQDVITAMILHLESKSHKEFEEITKDFSYSKQLMENELAFIKYQQDLFIEMKENKKSSSSGVSAKEKIEQAVLKDLKREGLIRYIPSLQHLQIIDFLPFIFFMLNIMTLDTLRKLSQELGTFLFTIDIIANVSWILIYFVSIHFQLHLRSNLEKKGQIYVNTLYASKEFLTDFSIISQRSIKEEALWNSYLRNAILFDLKGNLDKEATEYYHKIISNYSCYSPNKTTSGLRLSNYILKFMTNCIFWGIMMFLLIASFLDNSMFWFILFHFLLLPMIYFSFIKYLYPYSNKKDVH